MAVFYSGVFNPNVYFTDGGAPPVDVVVKTGTGGIDPGDGLKRRRIVKPLGLLDKRRKEGRKDVEDRVDEAREIQADVAGQLAREFTEELAEDARILANQQALEGMTRAQIEAEIGVLMRKKARTEEEEMMLVIFMVAAQI